MLILTLGGSRSGKSELAEAKAADYDRVAYLATSPVTDPEMAERIRIHQQRRPANWQTIEEQVAVAKAVTDAASQFDCLLIDCLTLWVSNMLFAPDFENASDEQILDEVRELCLAATTGQADVIVVSSEVGCGVVPDNAISRRFRDLVGWANQIVAEQADAVYLVVAGIAQQLKSPKSPDLPSGDTKPDAARPWFMPPGQLM